MNRKRLCIIISLISLLLIGNNSYGQKRETAINDSNAPLHLLQPSYKTPYGILTIDEVTTDMNRVLHYLENNTPTEVINSKTGKRITNYASMTADAQLKRGAFRLGSYEWGVTYSAMLNAAEATGDKAYLTYVTDRFHFLSEVAPYFNEVLEKYGTVDPQMRQILTPHALDDAGAICTAMIKAQLKDKSLSLKPLIENYINYIMYHQYRLLDGTFARKRPQLNTVWLDDMFMGIPPLAWYARIASDNQQNYVTEAARQVLQFKEKMWVPEKGLFRHGWVEGMQEHPSFFWGRANGWALLAMCEVLDILPDNYPQRSEIMKTLRTHIRSLVSYQSSEGFWHQLLDRNDSYLETSATAIYVYCMAHAINKGWIDPMAYGPTVQLGWHAISTKINDKGQVEGTCVGTGMGFDPAFYYNRPVNVYAAHGYGPVIAAGAEIIKLLKHQHPKMNDGAVQYYTIDQRSKEPIFDFTDPNNPKDIAAGFSRKDNKTPVVFLIGDSTVKCGNGKGEQGKWGWGSFLEQFFDTTRISIENWALGGRSSRTYFTEGLWAKVLPAIRQGDYLLIDFGHNDGGPFNTGRARASIKGTGDDTLRVVMERDGSHETIHTYGYYMRKYIRQAKAQGATVIVTSHTPGNRWTANTMNRCTDTYAKWSEEVARQEGAYYIDLNNLTALKFEAMGKEKTAGYYGDSVHNTKKGALLNDESIIEGIRSLKGCKLANYLK